MTKRTTLISVTILAVASFCVFLMKPPVESRLSTPVARIRPASQPNAASSTQIVLKPGDVKDLATVDEFLRLFSRSRATRLGALKNIESHWQPGSAVMLVECLRLLRREGTSRAIIRLLKTKTGHKKADNINEWFEWIWKQKYEPHPHYASFKAKFYANVDPKFNEYFNDAYATTIRLDEIRWGGVARDGIPPLKNPQLLAATRAKYLKDSNIVFGIEIDGDARAYPKRILAWHEMVKDNVGKTSINGVYCTLCGSMIIYRTEVNGVHYELGTSGFLFRSNKLMYDHKTKSLWSTLTGQPVVGPLVGKQIKLEQLSVVTTTWGQWRRDHPHTTVLSLKTGHKRDYREGVAYKKYFSKDKLMFSVSSRDKRLKNKAEVLALRFGDSRDEPLAISSAYLKKKPVYHDSLGKVSFVVLTDPSGAHRVYETGPRRFISWNPDTSVAIDSKNHQWQASESELTDPGGESLRRLPAHRAFWFGWHAAFPKTRLVH